MSCLEWSLSLWQEQAQMCHRAMREIVTSPLGGGLCFCVYLGLSCKLRRVRVETVLAETGHSEGWRMCRRWDSLDSYLSCVKHICPLSMSGSGDLLVFKDAPSFPVLHSKCVLLMSPLLFFFCLDSIVHSDLHSRLLTHAQLYSLALHRSLILRLLAPLAVGMMILKLLIKFYFCWAWYGFEASLVTE